MTYEEFKNKRNQAYQGYLKRYGTREKAKEAMKKSPYYKFPAGLQKQRTEYMEAKKGKRLSAAARNKIKKSVA